MARTAVLLAAVVTGLLFGGAAWAAEPVESSADRARAILEEANAAMVDVGALSYRFTYQGVYSARSRIQGTVVHQPGRDGSPHQFRLEMSAHLPPPHLSTSPIDLLVVSDGSRIWRHRVGEKTAHTGTSGARYLGMAFSWGAVPQMLRGNQPLGVELQMAEEMRWAGTESVDGTLCDVVYLRFPVSSGMGEQFLSFGREDRFLRHIAFIASGSPPFAFDMRVEDLRTGVEVGEDTFSWSVPEGVELVDVDEQPIGPGEIAPDWVLTSLEGNSVSMSGLRGRVVVLDFWATWCPFCAANAPGLAEIARSLDGDGVSVLGLNLWENGDPAEWKERHGIEYSVLLEASDVAERYKVSGTPTTIVVGRDGRIRHIEGGGPPETRLVNLRRAIERALER